MTETADNDFVALQQALAGDYSLERELGRGGMGIVYLAREVLLDRLVAIKVLRPDLASRPDVRARFLREARLAASLSHPNIVQIFRVAEGRELIYLTMQCVHGETLGERLRRRGPMKPDEVVTMLRQVAWALSHAHRGGIIHRDVKPDNILLDRETGRAIVSDFGIATDRGDASRGDLETVMGSAHFMSPEQGHRGAVDERSDLYSLAVVGYLALSGRFPFEGASLGELLVRQERETAPSVAAVASSVPRALAGAIDRALRADPAERYPTVDAFAAALQETGVARPALPAELRTWVEARSPWTVINVAWAVFWTSMGLTAHPSPMQDFVLAAAAPTFALLLRGRILRQLFARGYTVADMRFALQSAEDEGRGARAEQAKLERRWSRRLFRGVALVPVSIATGVFLLISISAGHLPEIVRTIPDGMMTVIFTAALAAVPLSYALGVPLFPGIRPLAHLRQLFWKSRFGAQVARLLTPAHPSIPENLVHRPTEIALGTAIEALFRALPSPYRQTAGDLPAVVQRLEAHAQRARAQLAMLDRGSSPDLPIGAQPDDSSAAREGAQRELQGAIGALESLRLHLLRLHGGAADLAPVTTVLDAARRVGDDLDRLSSAQSEVSGAPTRRLPFDFRTPTPA